MATEGIWQQWRRYPAAGFLGGVCAGIAARLELNPRLVRVIALLVLVFGFFLPTMLVYCVLWYLMDPAIGHPGQSMTDASPDTPQGPADLARRFGKLEARLRDMEACVASEEFELRRQFRRLG